MKLKNHRALALLNHSPLDPAAWPGLPRYPAEAPARLTRLDGLRGIAACVVAFAYHPRSLFAPELFTGHGALLAWLSHWGWAFVDLFFLLSGYIFAHVYLAGKSFPARVRWNSSRWPASRGSIRCTC